MAPSFTVRYHFLYLGIVRRVFFINFCPLKFDDILLFATKHR